MEYHQGQLTIIDDSMMAPAYIGSISISAMSGKSSVELSRAPRGPSGSFPVGSITWSSALARFHLTLASGRDVPMKHGLNILSRKTKLSSSQGELTWKGAGALHTHFALVNGAASTVATLGDLLNISTSKLGSLELIGPAGQDSEFMDEVVLSGLGMLMQEKATALAGILV